jgi:hypothetical protein
MNMKKVLPLLLLVVMALITLAIRRCNNPQVNDYRNQRRTEAPESRSSRSSRTNDNTVGLDRNTDHLYFTKHAKCRMRCRHITQQEVKDIIANGTINYNKSDLNDPRGATYALEGMTQDNQHVRIIVSPKLQHLTVVTVIDLEVEYECNCT